jgi:hypothetical protein
VTTARALAAGVVAASVFVAAHSAANAASISSTISKEGKVVVSIAGAIAEGDADALRSVVKSANESGRLVSGIRLNSPGGSLAEGVRLAEIIRFGKIATVVANGATCASACFVAFAAGDPKYVSYSASVGIHGASDANGHETVEAGAATVSMARIVKDLGVPTPIIGKMVVTPPDQIVWLGPDDLRSMGTTMTGKPAQVPPDQSATTAPPMQLDPAARAILPPAPETNQKPTWKELVDAAFALSARQNGGVPNRARTCQPELGLCNTAVMLQANDGTDMMVRAAEDKNGGVVRRDICRFNQFKDVRVCTDWDTGVTIREMMDRKGEWYKVGDE